MQIAGNRSDMRCQSDSRQRQILDLVLAGHPSKNIAADLGISQRTVDTIARQ
jgi:two-component system, chemotaxis family, CheB/CheR fusion protein